MQEDMKALNANASKKTWLTVQFAAFALIAMLAVCLFRTASFLTLDYFDATLQLLNARSIATGELIGYSQVRPMGLPMALASIFYFTELTGAGDIALTLSHYFMVAVYLTFLWTVYRLFRLYAGSHTAAFAVLLLSLNRALVHAAPFCKEDIFALLLMSAAFYFYLKGIRKEKRALYGVAGFFIAWAILSRYNYGVLFAVIFVYEVVAGHLRLVWAPGKGFVKDTHTLIRLALIGLVSGTLIFFTVSSVYSMLGLYPFREAFYKHLTGPVLYLMKLSNTDYYVSPWRNVIFLQKICSWPILILCLAGIFAAWKKSQKGTSFFLTWFAVFFLYQTFLVPHKEARYLMSFLPPLYFFAAIGFDFVSDILMRKSPGKTRWIVVFFLGATVLALPVQKAWAEIRQFEDPVYKTSFVKELSRIAAETAQDRPLYWVGPLYPLHPKEYVFDTEDNYYALYHIHSSSVYFHTGKYVDDIANLQIFLSDGEPAFVEPRIADKLRNRDTLIINSEKDSYFTHTLPEQLRPLYIQKVVKIEFLNKETLEDGATHFESVSEEGGRILIRKTDSGIALEGEGIPDSLYGLYIKFYDDPQMHFSPLDISDGKLRVQVDTPAGPDRVSSIFLMIFKTVKMLEHP